MLLFWCIPEIGGKNSGNLEKKKIWKSIFRCKKKYEKKNKKSDKSVMTLFLSIQLLSNNSDIISGVPDRGHEYWIDI